MEIFERLLKDLRDGKVLHLLGPNENYGVEFLPESRYSRPVLEAFLLEMIELHRMAEEGRIY